MRFRRYLFIAIAGFFTIGLISANWSSVSSAPFGERNGWGMWGPFRGWHEHWYGPDMSPWHQGRMRRHWQFMHGQIPDEYRNLKSPLAYTNEVYAEGARIYAKRCAECHGKDGMGDGETGKDLSPSPSLLAYLIQRPIAVDEYLMWTISDGGKALGTDMPAFKKVLKQGDIWKVIAYMRAGFPYMNDVKK